MPDRHEFQAAVNMRPGRSSVSANYHLVRTTVSISAMQSSCIHLSRRPGILLFRGDQNIPHNQPLAVEPRTVLGKFTLPLPYVGQIPTKVRSVPQELEPAEGDLHQIPTV